MASKKNVQVVVKHNKNIVDIALDDDKFNALINRLTTIINFAEGATQAMCKLKGTLATINVI